MLRLEKQLHDRRYESSSGEFLKNFESTSNNDTDLLFQTAYGTVQMTPEEKTYPSIWTKCWKSECFLAGTVILFGMFATFSSTYYNFFDIKSFDQFWSPCIRNISLSYTLIEF